MEGIIAVLLYYMTAKYYCFYYDAIVPAENFFIIHQIVNDIFVYQFSSY